MIFGWMARSRTLAPDLRGWALTGALLVFLTGCATVDTPKLEYVWPKPPEQPRITFVRSVGSKEDMSKSGAELFMEALVGKKKQREGLSKPYGVHADKDGRLFVADSGLGHLLVFDFAKQKFSRWGVEGKGALARPVGITSDSRDRVYVTDADQHRVVVYDGEGNFLNAIGKKGELETPAGIAVNEKTGRMYVVDVKKHHIAVFDMDGALVSTIGTRGEDPGQFNYPTNLAMDKAGKLYVADSMNFRIQVLDPDGKVLRTFGKIGDGPGQFAKLKGIAVDSEGHIYASDAAFNNFQIFDQEGRLLLFVGELGRRPGQFWLPAGMAIDGNDRIYIADQYNVRVQVFQYVKEERPGTRQPAEAQQAGKKGGDQRHNRQDRTEGTVTAQQNGGEKP